MEREFKENAICLNSSDIGEFDKMLTLLTPEHGLIYAKIKGVKKPKAKLAFCSFPFALGEYIFVKVGNFNTVLNCSHTDSFFELTYDLNKFYAGSSMLEITRKIAKENQPCTGLFVSLLKALQKLCYTNLNMYAILTKYVLNCLEFCGLEVNIDVNLNTTKQAYLNFESGTITNNLNNEYVPLSEKDLQSLVELLSGDIDIISSETAVSKNLLKLIVTYFQVKTDEHLEVINKFFQ